MVVLGAVLEVFFAFVPLFSLADAVEEAPLVESADRVAPAFFAVPGAAVAFAAALEIGRAHV